MPKTIGTLTLYDLKELSEQLDLTLVTLRRYLREGRIRGQKLGQTWYVSDTALEAYFNGPTSGNTENRK